MVFWHKKKTTIQEMLDREATCWHLTNDSRKLALPVLIEALKSTTIAEIEDLKEVKKELEEDEKVKSGLTTISPKFEKLEKELETLKNLLIKQLGVINSNTIKTIPEKEIRKYLQGDSSELSEISKQIRKLLKIVEEDLKEFEFEKKTINNRFILKEDTIYDTKTKITWDRDLAKAGKMNWENAKIYAEQNKKQFPTREDYWNLTHEIGTWNIEGGGSPTQLDMKEIGFINVRKACYQWTSEESSSAGIAWIVNLNNGNDSYNVKSNSYYVTCVVRD